MLLLKMTFLLLCLSGLTAGCLSTGSGESRSLTEPCVVVLGIAQDGGVPQAGDRDTERWIDRSKKRLVTSLAIVDPATSQRWILDATPDFREQLHLLDRHYPVPAKPGIDGILLTHAHMGHYTGLMFLGLESMGTKGVPVFAMPRMAAFLRDNGPWSQLVAYRNIVIEPLAHDTAVQLNDRLSITPFLVPHRQEYSEVVGFRIDGPNRSVLFIPDIDKWEDLDAMGTRIEEKIADVDAAYLDGTFFSNREMPGRDMSSFPHPKIESSMRRFEPLPASERGKVRFLHLNHTNPALSEDSEARQSIEEKGFHVAEELERISL